MKLLIALDNSECSSAAVAETLRVGWPRGTSVLLLSAVRSDVFLVSDVFISAAEQIERLLGEEAQQAEVRLSALAPTLMAAGLAVTTRVTRGDPRFVIIDAAADEKIDLVIVGSHGQSGLKKLLLGSVASHVMTHAACSVLVVKRQVE